VARRTSQPVKSRRVCRVLWFDRRGRFARPPKHPAPHLRPRITKRTTLRGVEGGGKAVITHANHRVISVRYVPPADIRKNLAKARKAGDRAYVKAFEQWKREVERDIAAQAQKELDRERSLETAAIMEQAYRSSRAKKAAATRKKKRAQLEESDRLKARALADSLGLRIKEAELRLARTRRGTKTAAALSRRIERWQKAREKLNRIAAGRAYTWPKPSELR